MSLHGQDIIEIGSTRVGQKYILGADVPLDNPDWKGPWDCAEFASWCVYQAYGLVFGAGNPKKIGNAEPYSGYWFTDAKKTGTVISWQDALHIEGAVLIRAPKPGKIGHVAFAMGDGDRTLEARGAAFGVGIFRGAATRPWDIGLLLPGVDYGLPAQPPVVAAARTASYPAGYLWLKTPAFRSPEVLALQRALAAKDLDPGPVDGVFGDKTSAAIQSFQVSEGLEFDGIAGPNTVKALGLDFPIQATPEDRQAFAEAKTPKGPADIPLPQVEAFDGIVDIAQSGKTYRATSASGFTFIIGTSVSYTDDMNRLGLYQAGAAIKDSLDKFGGYEASSFEAAFGQWAYFIAPTLLAEGNARFATLNTYDRAAFTFGAPQLAAHTPGKNFILYLRELLGLPDADKHFPDLSLRANGAGTRTVHLKQGGSYKDLEQIVEVTRPNGKKEKQLAHLMKFLNASPTAVDAAELSASARLMNWLRLDPMAKELQIKVFIEGSKANLKDAKSKIDGFDGRDWRSALWIMDILHQGRGTYAEMTRALATNDPEAALRKIGAQYGTRIRAVMAGIDRIARTGKMEGLRV